VKTNVVKNVNCHPVGTVRRNTALAVVNIVKVAMSIFAKVVKQEKNIALPKIAEQESVESVHPIMAAKSVRECSAAVIIQIVVNTASKIFAWIAILSVSARAGFIVIGKGTNVLDATRRFRRDL
jgi:hypothetical protein